MATGTSATSQVDRIIDNLVRDIAKVVTELDAARPIFRKN